MGECSSFVNFRFVGQGVWKNRFEELNYDGVNCNYLDQGVKRNNRVFVISLFLLEKIRYSTIPVKKNSLFRFKIISLFRPVNGIIPLFQHKKNPLFLFYHSS